MTRVARKPTAWGHWYRRALPAYWIFLFCATHFPEAQAPVQVPHADKYMHLVAFGLLAFLYWRFVEAMFGAVSARFVWITAAWFPVYAAFDEYTQVFFNRGTSVWDWAADVLGAYIVLAYLECRRRMYVSRQRRME